MEKGDYVDQLRDGHIVPEIRHWRIASLLLRLAQQSEVFRRQLMIGVNDGGHEFTIVLDPKYLPADVDLKRNHAVIDGQFDTGDRMALAATEVDETRLTFLYIAFREDEAFHGRGFLSAPGHEAYQDDGRQ
jgi:hypothetical protein